MCDVDITRKLHYIVDGSGNYYRVNNKDQLVIAKERRDAGVFSYVDANQRIGAGKKSHFYSAIPIGEELPIPDSDSLIEDLDTDSGKTKDIIRVVQDVKGGEETDVPLSLPYDLKRMDWEAYMLHFAYIVSNLQNYKEELIEKQSDLDLQICDILHYIELYEVDDRESVQILQLLKECREERRDVKDEWCRVDHFQRALGNSGNVVKVKEAMKQIGKLEKRSYRPRKLETLFQECPEKTERDNKLMRVFSGRDCLAFMNEDREKKLTENIEDKGSDRMEYMKQWTAFDGKKNDWVAFAKQQMEFYMHIEQYMMNLQMEVMELGEQIEMLLCEVEDANYNVAQGYKVFKALKDLRNERKEKQEELLQLRVLTRCMDCGRMAEVLQAGLQELEGVKEMNVLCS